MIIKGRVSVRGSKRGRGWGDEALREHSGHDGLHTPISPMKSLPWEKKEKGGEIEGGVGGGSGQCFSSTNEDHPKNTSVGQRRCSRTH